MGGLADSSSLVCYFGFHKEVNNYSPAQSDSTRIAELNLYWDQLNSTVMEGDFESYKQLFHDDAVIIFASGSHKSSVPITTALAGWKQGFNNTKEGKTTVNVTCRFSQRIGDATTAHESGNGWVSWSIKNPM